MGVSKKEVFSFPEVSGMRRGETVGFVTDEQIDQLRTSYPPGTRGIFGTIEKDENLNLIVVMPLNPPNPPRD